jgi:hypothetical protein
METAIVALLSIFSAGFSLGIFAVRILFAFMDADFV